jgi:SAM-dependent methyltransferase
MKPTHAFDALAESYDDDFTYHTVAQMLRDDVRQIMLQTWKAGAHILELGCGTGEDAYWMMNNGFSVCATDASPAMLEQTKQKLAQDAHSEDAHSDVRMLDINQLASTSLPHTYEGVLANFGVLNCALDLPQLAAWLHQQTKPDVRLILVVMAPNCLWEFAWHLLHGDWRTATRRWRRNTSFRANANSESISITYPTPMQLAGDFAPHFEVVRIMPLGVTLPPSDVYGVIEKHPKWLQRLRRWEKWAQKKQSLAQFADHYVMVLKKADE